MCFGVDLAMSRGYMDEAVRTYQGVLAEVDSTGADPSVLCVIAGKAAEGLGRHDEAAEWYGKAISADPSNPNAHAAMGCILARAGRGTDALASYDRAVEIDPRYANMHMGRGNVLWHLGRPADALESYRRGQSADSRPPYHDRHAKRSSR